MHGEGGRYGKGACMAIGGCVTRGTRVAGDVHGGGGACVVKRVCVMGWGYAWQKAGMGAGETATEAGGMHPTGMHSCTE